MQAGNAAPSHMFTHTRLSSINELLNSIELTMLYV